MKRTELQELKKRPKEDLVKLLKEKREKLRDFKLDLAMGKIKKIQELRAVKKDVARILTFIHGK